MPHPLSRFRRASQAVHATQALDEVLTRIIAELHSALDAEAASVALLDKNSGEIMLRAAGPVAETISGLRLPSDRGIIGWVIANGKSSIVNQVTADDRFWPEIDSYTGFETRSILCAPLVSGQQVIGALEVLNKRQGGFTAEDLMFLEAFGAVAASAIESAQRFRREQQRRREADTLRRAWEVLTAPRDLDDLLDVILDQLEKLITYRSASILLVTEDEGLELSASRGIERKAEATELVRKLGLDVKVRTMLETHQPLLIPDTRADSRWQHFPSSSYIRSWIGAPLLIRGHLIGTLNVDHDQPNFYNAEHAQLMANFSHQAAIAIENSRLYAATHRATLQLAKQARRMVTLYEASRALLSGLELNRDALFGLVSRITDLIGARYGILNILAYNSQPPLFITVGPTDASSLDLDLSALEHSILDVLSSEREIIRNNELREMMGTDQLLPPAFLDSFLGVAIHARGRTLGRLLLADKQGNRRFGQDDEALALALATNLAGAIENAILYHKTQQRLRELSALYELTRTFTAMKETSDVYTHLATQVARLLDAERCALFIYKNGVLECQPPGFGLPPDIIPLLRFPIKKDSPVFGFIHAPNPLICNEVMHDPDLAAYRPILSQLQIRRMQSCHIPIDEDQTGFLIVADKRGGEEFNEQDRHLLSIMANQVSNVLQRALLQARQREQAQIQSALLQVSQAISSLTNLDELLQAVAQITHQLVGCDHCLIASWEERQSAFTLRAQSGLDPALRKTLPQTQLKPADIPFIQQAIEARKPILLTREEIRETGSTWTQSLLGVENNLVVPLVLQDRVVGLIVAAYTQRKRPPGERATALVTGIARQAAVAIENAHLYQDLQLHATRLERAYRDLKKLDERKAQFIQNVSHELRTPFTLIKGYLELLQEEEIGSLSEKQKEGLAVIAEKTEALGQLILDIVTAQSIDVASLDLQEFDLGLLLRSALAKHTLDAPGIHFESDLPAALRVKADPAMLERVLKLLLDNAVKFSPAGGLITLRARSEGEMIRVEIKDQGIGIPADALPNVFDSFYQVDGSTTRRFGGTGLGLSIANNIITAHGGEISVESAEGAGSTFYFTLPLTGPPSAAP